MKNFVKTFCILSVIYFLTMIYSQWNLVQDVPPTNFKVYADPPEDDDDDDAPPPIPPITQSPIPSDTIVILSDGTIVIIK